MPSFEIKLLNSQKKLLHSLEVVSSARSEVQVSY